MAKATIALPDETKPNAELLAELEALKSKVSTQDKQISTLTSGAGTPPDDGEEYMIQKEISFPQVDRYTKWTPYVKYVQGMCGVCGRDYREFSEGGATLPSYFEVNTDEKEKIRRTIAIHSRVEHPGQAPRFVKKSDIPTSNIDGKSAGELGIASNWLSYTYSKDAQEKLDQLGVKVTVPEFERKMMELAKANENAKS